jgi:hypothetical protein
MTLQYAAERGECCSACNPLELVQLRTCVARITGPGGVEIRLCVRCLDALMMIRPEVNVFERQGVPRLSPGADRGAQAPRDARPRAWLERQVGLVLDG